MTSTIGRSSRPTERNYLSIREVLELLIDDFEDITISKIRFLEARGLIHPERTPSGYRKFYKDDVERLRWILRQQRENYLPLNVIKVRLDGGEVPQANEASAPSLFDDEGLDDPAPMAQPTPAPPAPTPTVSASTESSATSAPTTLKPPALLRGHPAEGTVSARRIGNHVSALDDDNEVDEEPVDAPERRSDRSSAIVTFAGSSKQESAATSLRSESKQRREVQMRADPEKVESAPLSPPANRASRGGGVPGYSMTELAAASGARTDFLSELEEYGLICAKQVAGVRTYDDEALEVVKMAAAFSAFGIEPRHLKSLQHAALREAELFTQVVTPLLRQRNPDAHAKAEADLVQLAMLGASFKSAVVQAELRSLTGG